MVKIPVEYINILTLSLPKFVIQAYVQIKRDMTNISLKVPKVDQRVIL